MNQAIALMFLCGFISILVLFLMGEFGLAVCGIGLFIALITIAGSGE